MKSLSKGNKKDTSSSTLNLRESTTIPLSSSLPRVSTYEDDIADSWPEQADGEDYDASEEFYEPEKPTWKKNMKPEVSSYASEDKMRRFSGQTKLKEPAKFDTKNSHPDDDLNALL